MFLESEINHTKGKGSIEVICGSMFSGKTEELLRRLKRAGFAKLNTIVFKHKIDVRYTNMKVISHDSNSIISNTVNNAEEILELVNEAEVVGIDEAQFFNNELVEVCNYLANNGKRVIVAGLDMDFQGNPFGIMPHLLSIADSITKVHAICVECGYIANYSYRIARSKELVQIGEKDKYKALCRTCFSQKKK